MWGERVRKNLCTNFAHRAKLRTITASWGHNRIRAAAGCVHVGDRSRPSLLPLTERARGWVRWTREKTEPVVGWSGGVEPKRDGRAIAGGDGAAGEADEWLCCHGTPFGFHYHAVKVEEGCTVKVYYVVCRTRWRSHAESNTAVASRVVFRMPCLIRSPGNFPS